MRRKEGGLHILCCAQADMASSYRDLSPGQHLGLCDSQSLSQGWGSEQVLTGQVSPVWRYCVG